LEGSGGAGKTELAKHIMAFIRSQTKADGQPYLIHTVCSTALGAQNYPQGECTTAHSFFVLPVEQEFDKEIDDDCMQCLAATKPQRYELIQAIDVIFWDEAMSNHRECLEAVMNEFDNLKGMRAATIRKHVTNFIILLFNSRLHYRQSSDFDARCQANSSCCPGR